MTDHALFATCPRGVEPLLVAELTALGALDARERKGGVAAHGDLATLYRACLWSRLASRILLPVAALPATDADALYNAARAIDWPDLFDAGRRFAVDVAGRTPGIANTHFAALRIKDAIVDTFRAEGRPRPDVDTDNPDLRIHLHLDRNGGTLSVDLVGEGLHRRGYRRDGVEAPLKENLACAILARCGWPARGGTLFDPMCGSGTFLIEGAWMTADVAPGLLRRRWGFQAWRGHDADTWTAVKNEALARRDAGLATLQPHFVGRDLDPRAIRAAATNAARAGLGDLVSIDAGDALEITPPADAGLVICNPPYGERLASEAELIRLYSLFGTALKTRFAGWHVGFFTARDDLAPRLGLRATSRHALYNGALACTLLQLEIPVEAAVSAGEAAADFTNRLRKNQRHLAKWARRSGVGSYRLYDADLPEYAVAVDHYETEDDGVHVQVQEYAPPASIDPVRAEQRLRGALAALVEVLELPPSHLHFKRRESQKGSAQYTRQGDRERVHVIREHGCRLQVNFDDYLDTGVFLDHRPMRQRLQAESRGKRLLNLFCYTGAASVHAAVGGASGTVSVDLSNTYLDWAQRNLALNGHGAQRADRGGLPRTGHVLVRADAREWLHEQARRPRPERFDLIFLDPPTFSNSKRMEGSFDVRRDHAALIEDALRLLTADGTLYFSTNRRGFRLDAALVERFDTRDITAATLDEDFRRPPPAHRCWSIRHR